MAILEYSAMDMVSFCGACTPSTAPNAEGMGLFGRGLCEVRVKGFGTETFRQFNDGRAAM